MSNVKILRVGNKKGIISVRKPESHVNLAHAIARYRKVMEQVKSVVFDRSEEIDALALAVLIGEHVMLKGKHGIAKSMLATEFFGRIVDSEYFEIQLMKGTQPDQIFGPMDSRIYREEARWEHNTESFLPRAHFAFIDETYRASDSLLGSLMGILNERKFHNGPKLMRCPLITAIGTTNFVTDTPELEAFHDRWLIQANIQPLKSKNVRVKMLKSFYDHVAGEKNNDERATITLTEIEAIRANLGEVQVEPILIDLFEELCSGTIRAMPGKIYLSDRRLCLTFKLVLAQALLSGKPIVKPEHLIAARFGACELDSSASSSSAFDSVFQTVVGGYDALLRETAKTHKTEEWTNRLVSFFDPDMKAEALIQMRSQAEQVLAILRNPSEEGTPKNVANQERHQRAISDLSNLIASINELPKAAKGAAGKVKRSMNKKAPPENVLSTPTQ